MTTGLLDRFLLLFFVWMATSLLWKRVIDHLCSLSSISWLLSGSVFFFSLLSPFLTQHAAIIAISAVFILVLVAVAIMYVSKCRRSRWGLETITTWVQNGVAINSWAYLFQEKHSRKMIDPKLLYLNNTFFDFLLCFCCCCGNKHLNFMANSNKEWDHELEREKHPWLLEKESLSTLLDWLTIQTTLERNTSQPREVVSVLFTSQ